MARHRRPIVTLNMSSSGTNKQQTSLFSFFGGGDGTKSSGGGGTSSSGKKSKSDTSGGRASKHPSTPASSKKAKTNSSNKGGKKNAASTTAPNKQKKDVSSGPSKKKRRIADDKPAPDTATTTTPRKPSSVMIDNAPDFSSFSYAKGGEAAVAAAVDDTPMSAATTRTAASTPSPSLKSASPPLDTTDADIDIDDNADAPIEVAERKDAKDARDEQEVGSPTAEKDANEGVAEEAQTSLANVENATTNASDSDSEVDDSSDSASDSESTSARGEHQLSDYELLRLRNIERNNRRLAELGLAGDWSSAMPSNATQQQAKKKRARKKVKGDTTKARTPAMPTRRSTRARRTVLEATAEGEGSFGASNLSAEGIDVAKPKYQEMAEIEEEAVEEVFTVSPMLEYAMNADGAAGDAADSSIHEEWSTNTQPNDIQCLKPIGKRLAPPNGLGAIYSLQFYPQEWCPEQRSGNHSWMVGAGKAGIISLWDCNWSASSSKSAAEDEMIDPVLSWKAHSGRWVADVRFLPSASAGSDGEISKSPPSRLLSAANDGFVCLWDLSTVSSLNGSPKMLCRTGKELHRSGIFAMDVDVGQTQTHIATGSKDKTVAVTALDAIARGIGFAEPSWVSDYHAAKVGAVALCGKGTSLVASASDDGSIAVHDFRADGKKRVVAELIDAHYRPHSVAWDPLSANHLMTAGLDDQIKVFDIRSLDKPLFTYQGHVPTLSKYKRIHHPVFYNPCQRRASSELFVLSGGESSAALSMFRNEDAKESVVSVYSRGRLPADCGDAGCLAIQGQRVASTVDGGEVLLLAPKLKKAE